MGRTTRKIYNLLYLGLLILMFICISAEFEIGAWFLLIFFKATIGRLRCHDVGHSGWIQLLPFSSIYLMFAKGTVGANKYGADPRKENNDNVQEIQES